MEIMWIWLIGANVLAFWALRKMQTDYSTVNHFIRLGIISVWIFGGVFMMSP